MAEIPVGYGQANWIFGGAGLPNGAEMTCAFDVQTVSLNQGQIAAELYDAFADAFLPDLCNAVTLRGCLVKFGPTATGPSVLHSENRNGASTEQATAPNTTYLIHKQTAQGGRAGRGRMYLPGVAESVVSNAGDIQGSVITDFQGNCNTMFDRLAAADLPLMLLHGPGPLEGPPTILTSLVFDSRVATQRRRLRR